MIVKRTTGGKAMLECIRNAELGELQGRTSALINILLVVLKGALAAFSGSVALFADALNNLGDIAGSLVLIFGFRLSQKPRDRDHPYGHGRLRTVAGFVLAIILILVGVEAARSGIMRIIAPQPIKTTPWLLGAIAASIVLKAWLANFSKVLARITGDAGLKSEVASSDFQQKADQFHRHISDQVDGIRRLKIGIETDYASEPEFRTVY